MKKCRGSKDEIYLTKSNARKTTTLTSFLLITGDPCEKRRDFVNLIHFQLAIVPKLIVPANICFPDQLLTFFEGIQLEFVYFMMANCVKQTQIVAQLDCNLIRFSA